MMQMYSIFKYYRFLNEVTMRFGVKDALNRRIIQISENNWFY